MGDVVVRGIYGQVVGITSCKPNKWCQRSPVRSRTSEVHEKSIVDNSGITGNVSIFRIEKFLRA
jgi:hypothetical protein